METTSELSPGRGATQHEGRFISIIGAGPAGLMAAETLAAAGHRVTVFERMPTVGRKFLLAGRGGLNLTHSEPLERFLTRYHDADARILDAIRAFPPDALVRWANGLGSETFVGTSGRVFPRTMKSSGLLRAWLRSLTESGVAFRLRHTWTGLDASGRLTFSTPEGPASFESDATVLALGGASWPKLGSDGGWSEILAARGVPIRSLQASNCGVKVVWSTRFTDKFSGVPLKPVALSIGGARSRGELIVTNGGLEGGGIYALGAAIRVALAGPGPVNLNVDLRPDVSLANLTARLSRRRKGDSLSNALRKAGLSPVAISLLHEGHDPETNWPLGTWPANALAGRIKCLPIRLQGLADIDRAISTAGGIAATGLDNNFMLRTIPSLFACGEMLDWDAPTGGYLLQAAFATGHAAGLGAAAWLADRPADTRLTAPGERPG